MTCIVGLVDKGTVWLGGDSAGVAGYSLNRGTMPKVFRNGPMLIGYTTSFRMGQLLQYALKIPAQRHEQTDHEYLVTTFVDSVRDCLKAGGFASEANTVESGGTFLVGYRGQLYEVSSDYQIVTFAQGYASIGCGDDIALGSLYTSKGKPHARLMAALQAAEQHSIGVSAPFTIIKETL